MEMLKENELPKINTTQIFNLDDFSCAICLDLIYKPILTPCNHAFCFACFTENNKLEIKITNCPLCRAEIPNNFKLAIDKEFEKKVELLFPEDFQLRKNQFDEIALLEKDFVKLKISYGNTHKLVENNNNRNNYTNDPNLTKKHEWSVFINCGKVEDDKKYIAKVEFDLKPSFDEKAVLGKFPPFNLKKTGWGYFNIPITVHFNKKEIDSDPIVLNHIVRFEEGGEKKIIVLNLKKKIEELKLPKIVVRKKIEVSTKNVNISLKTPAKTNIRSSNIIFKK